MSLKSMHPSWIFVKQNTGLDWGTVVSNEDYSNRSLVNKSYGSDWAKEYYGTNWNIANRKAIEYCLDPRTYFTEKEIFAFEQLTYNPSYQTAQATQKIVDNSFMAGEMPLAGKSYANAFMEIGMLKGVSPFHLAGRVIQEQGTQGTSPMISGKYPGYEGYYNYYNIAASGSTNEAILTSGLKKQRVKIGIRHMLLFMVAFECWRINILQKVRIPCTWKNGMLMQLIMDCITISICKILQHH